MQDDDSTMNGHDVQLASSPIGDIDDKFTDVSLGQLETLQTITIRYLL